MVYDRIGQALATQFDQVGSFGLSTQLSSPVNANNEDNPDIRFQAINVIPDTLPDSASGRLPADAAESAAGQITSALDSSITTPYSHASTWSSAASLAATTRSRPPTSVGTGRNQLIRRDLMMPLNFEDKKSGVDYFTAAKQMIDAAHASGDPLEHRADSVLGERVPRAAGDRSGRRQLHGHAEHGRAGSWRTSRTG